MHRLPVCSTLLRQCRSSAAVVLQTTSGQLHPKRQLRTASAFKSKMALSVRERLKLNLILKCPGQLETLQELCGQRETKYEMSVNGQELHLISWKSNELTAVEEKIRQMLDEMITYEFQLSHAQRSLLKLNNLVNIRSLFEYGQEKVEVEVRGRSMNDDYIFTATGKPEALASFKRKLDIKINCIRYFQMTLPEFVPIDKDLLEVFKKINEYPSTVCFIENRTVKCWNLDKDTQGVIREKLDAVVERWTGQCEETWTGSDVMTRYVQNYLQSKEETALSEMVEGPHFLPNYDKDCVTLKLKGMRYPVKKLASEVARVTREAAHINIPIPTEVLNSLAASQFGSYWSKYHPEMLVILPTETEPSLTLVGPFDSVNHRLLYFYRILRVNFPDKFDLIQPQIVFKYSAKSQYKYDESGIIRELKQKFPDATFRTDKIAHTDGTQPVHLYISAGLDDLIKIDSILKAHVPIDIGHHYPDAGKIFNVLKENSLVSHEVESKSYAGGFRTQLKGPEPQSARQARDHILNIMDSGQRYRFFTFLNEGIRTVYASDRMIKDINDFAQNIEMPIKTTTYNHTFNNFSPRSCLLMVEGVGDFTQFLKMRNFLSQKFDFETYREISRTSTSDDDVTTGHKKRWLQQCHEQLLKELDGFTFLFQRYDKFCVGGSEEQLDQAQELLQSSLDGLCYDITDISGIYGLATRRLDIPVLQNKWPLVTIWTTQSRYKDKTHLKMVGSKESVNQIIQELPPVEQARSTCIIPLSHKGFPYLTYLGRKLFPESEVTPKSWPTLFPEKNCTISVNTVPLWNITLDGDPREVDEAQETLAEIMEGVHYREVYLSNSIICDGSEGSRSKLNRFKNALMSLDVPKRVVDNAEVLANVGLGKENMVFSVVGDQAKQVELAAGKLQDLSENLSVEELSLNNDHAQICQKYITNLKMTERKSRPFNVEYSINRKANVFTVFGIADDVKIGIDNIRNILSDTTSVTMEVEGEFQGPFIGDLIRHSYLNHIHPCACFYYNSRERTLAVSGPRVEVNQIQKFLEDATHETYKIDYHYENFVTLSGRLKRLATGVLMIEGKNRTVHLVGGKENVKSLVGMLDFIMGKKKSCYFKLTINDRDERVHLGTMTNLATKPVETMFPAVRWWLLGDELRFSGPESEAARALQYVVDKYLKRNRDDKDDVEHVLAES